MSKKLKIILLLAALIIFGLIDFKMFFSKHSLMEAQIANFEDCAKAGYPILESFPEQCRTSDGRTFVRQLSEEEKKKLIPPVTCVDKCGDGVCQEMVCLTVGCPCAESKENCPEDCDKKDNEKLQKGILEGKATVGPICPVERVGVPCPVPPEAYTSREVVVYETDGKTIVNKTNFDAEGNYRLELNSGDYIVDISKSGMDRAGGSQKVTIKVGEVTKLDFNIDTGIR